MTRLRVHIIKNARALCGLGHANDWPDGHTFVLPVEGYTSNCRACRDAVSLILPEASGWEYEPSDTA